MAVESSITLTDQANLRPGGISGIRRHRPSYSCEGCRARRVKCDLHHPQCGGCSRNGLSCLYPNLAPKCTSVQETSRKRSSSRGTRIRPSPGNPAIERTHTPVLSQQRTSFWSALDKQFDSFHTLLGRPAVTLVRTDSATFDIHGSSVETHPFLNLYEKMTMGSIESSCDFATLLEKLPGRDVCDRLYSVFMGCVHPITPYFHYPSFDRRYRCFWLQMEQWDHYLTPNGFLSKHANFLPLLLAVLYYGSIIEPLTRSADARLQEASATSVDSSVPTSSVNSAFLLALGTKALGLVNFPDKTTLSSLAGFMLLQMDQLRCQNAPACSFVAVSIRIAQSMGIHREDINSQHDDISAEERRRIWALLVHLDWLTARNSGLSPILSQHIKFTAPLSEVRDEYIGSPFAHDAQHAYPFYIVAHGRYEASACLKSIFARQAEGCVITGSDIEELLASVKILEGSLEQRIARLRSMQISSALPFSAPGLVSVPSHLWQRYDNNTVAVSRWCQTTLRYIIEQSYCDLYNLALSDVSTWEALRDQAIPHYQACLEYYTDLNTTHGYRPLQWLYPGYHQPLQIVAILLVDLYKHPSTRHSSESKSLIERLFTIYHKEDRTADSNAIPSMGNSSVKKPFASARMRLENLRKLVWSSLGLDESAMWSSSSPTQVSHVRHQPFQSIPGTFSGDQNFWFGQNNGPPATMIQNIYSQTLADTSIYLQTPHHDSDILPSSLSNDCDAMFGRSENLQSSEWTCEPSEPLKSDVFWLSELNMQTAAY